MPTEAELRENFGLPLQDVAVKMGIQLTALKKLCRKYGVMKWPHRKLTAIEKKISMLRQQLAMPGGSQDAQAYLDIAQLEAQRDKIYAGNVSACTGAYDVANSPLQQPSPAALLQSNSSNGTPPLTTQARLKAVT